MIGHRSLLWLTPVRPILAGVVVAGAVSLRSKFGRTGRRIRAMGASTAGADPA